MPDINPKQSATGGPGRIPETRDLATDGAIAGSGEIPMLILISQDHCPYCMQIKEEILQPMIIGEDYKGQLLIRELYMDPGVTVIDFKGEEVAGADFAHSYGVNLTPTLLFLDSEGKELTERIIGIYTPEMFFYFVNESIKSAIIELKGSGKN